jgi:hypothetical protein
MFQMDFRGPSHLRILLLLASGMLLLSLPIAAQGDESDEVAVGITIGLDLDTYGLSTEVGFILPFDEDGNGRFTTGFGSGLRLRPLLRGDITDSMLPIRWVTRFEYSQRIGDPTIGNPSFIGDPELGLGGGAGFDLDLQTGVGNYSVFSFLDVDPGPNWLRFRMPLLRYQFQNTDGTSETRLLGLTLNLYSNPIDCNPDDCLFDRGDWEYSVTSIPEPHVAWLIWSGLAGLTLLKRYRPLLN